MNMNRYMHITVGIACMFLSIFAQAADLDLNGFIDVRGGVRTQNDPDQKDFTLGEARIQLWTERNWDYATFMLRTDLLYDDVMPEDDLEIEEGLGWLDLREASVLLTPVDIVDLKIGRQILTWGTGDLVFINDMFPKDWQAFFIGRDEEYLKAPSDAVFISIFPGFANIDVAYIPRFDSDRYIRGSRLSYWNPMQGEIVGRNAVIEPILPNEWFDDHEIALRISKNVGGYEGAVYGYYGFWKNPKGVLAETMDSYFPELSVYGASLRGLLGVGLVNIEAGYYDSREDNAGDNPFVPNDEIRGLIGYTQELVKDLSIGVQYYVEHMQDYDQYEAALPAGMQPADEDRHLITLRLRKSAMSQNLTLSGFIYYSPTDEDVYARLAAEYKASDAWLMTAGANIFDGNYDHTFFGQFKNNSNVYLGTRYSF